MKELGQYLQETDLEPWVSVIRARWEKIPEFCVESARFRHLAIICDGNRRSAQEKGLHPWSGHRLGVEVIRGIMEAGKAWGIRHLTFWMWSTENWKRDREQINFVMDLAERYLKDEEAVRRLEEYKVRFTHFGRKDRLPISVREAIGNLAEKTKGYSEYFVNLALDYGGLDEVGRTVARMIEEGIKPEEVSQNPELILDYLDTAGQPLPDLVIRTGQIGGEVPHTSGFMPLQSSYSGWAFIPDLFPDLTPGSLLNEIQRFIAYERRMGR